MAPPPPLEKKDALRLAIVGSGAWGAAFGGALAADDCHIAFWDREPAAAREAARQAGETATAAATLEEALAAADVVVLAVSSAAFAPLLRQVAAAGASAPLLWLTKGFDPASGAPLCEVAAQTLPPAMHYGAVSGPSFASEVRRRLPCALALAMAQAETAQWLRQRLHRRHLRLYATGDVVGVCLAGALKNVVAIAAGISDGLALGENARAALIARGLAEMQALALAAGGQAETLLGLAGAGDLTLTCCSDLSRNRRLGLEIAKQGAAVAPSETCEGAAAAASAVRLAAAHGLQLPIIEAVEAVLDGRQQPAAAVEALLARPPR